MLFLGVGMMVPARGRRSAHSEHFRFAPSDELDHSPDLWNPAGRDVTRKPKRRRRRIIRRMLFLLCLLATGWFAWTNPTTAHKWMSGTAEITKPAIQHIWRKAHAWAMHTLDAQLDQAHTASPLPSTSETTSPQFGPWPYGQTPQSQYASGTATPSKIDASPQPNRASLAPSNDAERTSPKNDLAKPPVIIATAPPIVKIVPVRAEKFTKRQQLYVKRAKRAGLHERLSPAILSRLSKTDFKNAAFAIRSALRKTPDDATFKWPKHRKTSQAAFNVHFVPGAAKNCRRYVVTIEKARWLTTALPVEKCGIRKKPVRQQASRSKRASTVKAVQLSAKRN